MHLNAHRSWITPLVIGAFLLSSVTGILMFFHFDSGLNKTAHEWLSWAMVIGVSLHILLNLNAFKRYFTQTTGKAVMGLFAVILALSFIPAGGEAGGDPGFAPPVRALAKAPLPVLAQVLGMSPEALKTELAAKGHAVENDQQSLQDLVGPELRAQIQTINSLTKTAAQP
ncbi:hypothetical protein LPB72_06980 [Hydrogenophaga crassostreae]|uniref:Flavinylation-associated cytochrome domain-containing protein n=1 Tax=Hydrogenophaga crassostreae TaxID=1763535 RepID=A0A167IF92_9BURK|nr:DUF4405 domain-containing protein [Hydrogenophaga crassostreae]AOW13204.1 hypothetical protein LPB072_10395 [Hydrogenophaga crassostreae]OAD42649.1 hypothetical protein LPB72_06980 [Hydrogenophaga crassostreae]